MYMPILLFKYLFQVCYLKMGEIDIFPIIIGIRSSPITFDVKIRNSVTKQIIAST